MSTDFLDQLGRRIAEMYGLQYSGVDRIQNVDEVVYTIAGKHYRISINFVFAESMREALKALLERDGHRPIH
jgi:hypothetical protein